MKLSDANRLLIKHRANANEFRAYEQLLANGIKLFLAELSLVSARAIVSYICANQEANIDDIIASSAELSLRSGFLHYDHWASVNVEWGHPPAVSIGMEFRHDSLKAFFNIVFEEKYVGVDLAGILYKDKLGDVEENRERFALALADARLDKQE
jgi:hypothetical protein